MFYRKFNGNLYNYFYLSLYIHIKHIYLVISVPNTKFDFSCKLPETTIDNLTSQYLYFQISELD